MNQTTRPRRDPPGEQGNKRSSLKTPGAPGALGTRGNNVSVEFPLRLFQTPEETRSFQDRRRISSAYYSPPSLPRHWVNGRMRGRGGAEGKGGMLELPLRVEPPLLCCRFADGSFDFTSSAELPSQVVLSLSRPRLCASLALNVRKEPGTYARGKHSMLMGTVDASFLSSCHDCGAAASLSVLKEEKWKDGREK